MPPTPRPPEAPAVQKIDYEPYPPDRFFSEQYANNVFFEMSVWDLKLIFGLLDQRDGKTVIRQHTAISMAWPQVKVFYHWLRGHIEYHEHVNGKIVVPPMAIPTEGTPPTDEQTRAEPHAQKAYEIFKRLRTELIESQKS
jgi:hypothetical protein